jgi:DNA-binding CsgD family transcriptional regulator
MPPATGTKLTRRELEVMALILQGSTNREIADRLFVSCRTIDIHVARVLTKTGCRSRTELALKQREIAEGLALPASVAPVRITVDLSLDLYRKLTVYTAETSRDMGIVRLAHSEVIRALITSVDNDMVSGAVRAVIHASATFRAS